MHLAQIKLMDAGSGKVVNIHQRGPFDPEVEVELVTPPRSRVVHAQPDEPKHLETLWQGPMTGEQATTLARRIFRELNGYDGTNGDVAEIKTLLDHFVV